MQFNVELSELAETQYDNILSYISNVLKNQQALENVINDFDDTIEKLEKMADSFGYCNSKRLKEMGLHKIKFVMVEVQKLFPGIFHGLVHEGAVEVAERDLAVKIAVQLVQKFFPDGKWLGQAGHHLLGELLRGLPQPSVKGKFQAAGEIEHA